MLRLRGINYSIGDRDLLKNIELIINPGQRSALLGINGTGKTTLLKIINGELEQESGSISKPNEYRIGYLAQELTGSVSGKILESVKSGREDILTLENRLNQLRESLDSSDENKNSIRIKQLETAEAEFDSLNGYDLERMSKRLPFREQARKLIRRCFCVFAALPTRPVFCHPTYRRHWSRSLRPDQVRLRRQ